MRDPTLTKLIILCGVKSSVKFANMFRLIDMLFTDTFVLPFFLVSLGTREL